MDLTNKQVTHKSFGKGNVVECTDSYIEIHFSSGNKRFVFPDAIGTYLKLADQRVSNLIQRMKEKNEKERMDEALEVEKKKDIEAKEQKRSLEREKLIKSHKLFPSSQAAFWCDRQDLDKVFTEWRVFTGVRKSGVKEGQPNRLIRMRQNSACLITERGPDMPEKDRRIAGVYMVSDTFIGKLCKDGYIPAHPKYRLRFSEEESEKLLFWNYYRNEKYPRNMTWNTGNYRYLDNVSMAQILQDVVSLKKSPEEREYAQRFFEYFCRMNRIVERELPKADGALLHI